jgi:hypothetical protein
MEIEAMDIFWTFAGIGALVFLALLGVAMIIFAGRNRKQ